MRRFSRTVRPGKVIFPPTSSAAPLVDDLLGLEVGAVGPEDPDDPSMGMVEPEHGPQQRALAGAVGPEQRDDLSLGDLEVHVEEHLLVP